MGGVVNAAAYADGRKVRDIAIEEIGAVLSDPDRFVWIGVQEPDEALLRALQQAFGLHDLAVEDELDGLEEAIFTGSFSQAASERIYSLKRDLVALKRAVSPLVEVCNRLVRFDVKIIPEDARLYFRDVYDHVIRINETIDNL